MLDIVLLYLALLAQPLTHSRCSINVCGIKDINNPA